MEVLVLFGVLGFGVVAVLLRPRPGQGARPPPGPRASRHDNVSAPVRTAATPQAGRSVPDPIEAPPKATPDPAVFDAESATGLAYPQILSGRAWITDGDTIKINNTQIRLFGIDAPELNHPHGKNAKWALHRMCKGQTVRAVIAEVDGYGRTVARCYLPDGRDLSAEMVKQGLALDWPKFSGGKYTELERPGVRRKLFLADARQKGRMHVWEKFETQKAPR